MSLCQLLSFMSEANMSLIKQNLEILVNILENLRKQRTKPESKKVTNLKEIVEHLKRIKENNLNNIFVERERDVFQWGLSICFYV